MYIAMIGQKGIPAVYGGIERHVEDMSVELTKKGHDVLVYAREWYTPLSVKNYQGITVAHVPTIHTKHLDTISHTFNSTIHALFQKPDVFHFHGVGPALLCWLPRIFAPNAKVVVTFHCIDRYHQKWGWFAKLMLHIGEWAACQLPHKTIAVSHTIESYCLNEYHKSAACVVNGVNIPDKLDGSAAALAQWNLKPGKYVLMVSRLVQHKGAHGLIEAWQLARRQHKELLKDYKLAVVGDSVFTDDYVKWLKQLARGDDSIVFAGWQKGENLANLYAGSALFVHPSENEGLPISVLQAMSCGKPVLVSDIPEHKEIVDDHRFWFSVNSIETLADKLTFLIGDRPLLKTAGEKNLKTIKEKFAWSDLVEEVIKIYQSNYHVKMNKLKIAQA